MEDLSFLDHTGDVGFEVRAGTLEALFRRAARGLYEILVERPPATGEGEETIDVEDDAPDLLLRSFLSELLYRFLASRAILVDFPDFRIEGNRLRARGSAARFDPVRDGLRTELKAVTYHQLEVRRESSGWTARVIFDV
ncbi:MAG TPA: archease [Planctomycetota bacterium]|nr:archease [Planctomycetota bacterium]